MQSRFTLDFYNIPCTLALLAVRGLVCSIGRSSLLLSEKEDVLAATETFVPARLCEIPLADLQAAPNQPRRTLAPAALYELTESFKQQENASFATAPIQGT